MLVVRKMLVVAVASAGLPSGCASDNAAKDSQAEPPCAACGWVYQSCSDPWHSEAVSFEVVAQDVSGCSVEVNGGLARVGCSPLELCYSTGQCIAAEFEGDTLTAGSMKCN
jgi:hypothetical protein